MGTSVRSPWWLLAPLPLALASCRLDEVASGGSGTGDRLSSLATCFNGDSGSDDLDAHALFPVTGNSTPAADANVFSIAFWVRASSGAPSGKVAALSTDALNALEIRWESGTSRLQFEIFNNGLTQTAEAELPRDVLWHHVVATFDANLASEQMKLYVDGALADTINQGGDLFISAGRTLSFSPDGARLSGTCLDEASLWHRALSADEAERLSRSEAVTGAAFEWHLGEGAEAGGASLPMQGPAVPSYYPAPGLPEETQGGSSGGSGGGGSGAFEGGNNGYGGEFGSGPGRGDGGLINP